MRRHAGLSLLRREGGAPTAPEAAGPVPSSARATRPLGRGWVRLRGGPNPSDLHGFSALFGGACLPWPAPPGGQWADGAAQDNAARSRVPRAWPDAQADSPSGGQHTYLVPTPRLLSGLAPSHSLSQRSCRDRGVRSLERSLLASQLRVPRSARPHHQHWRWHNRPYCSRLAAVNWHLRLRAWVHISG